MKNRDMPATGMMNDNEYEPGLTKLEYAAINFHAARLVNNKFAHPQNAFEEANLFFDELEKQ